MQCSEARERILDADPAELLQGSSTLGRHLASCPSCSALAAGALDQVALLQRALDTPPQRSVDDVLAALTPNVASGRIAPLHQRRRGVPAAAATAAAAAILVLVLRPWSGPPPQPGPASVAIAEAVPPVVEDAGLRDFAVFTTRDERITVVWIYEEQLP